MQMMPHALLFSVHVALVVRVGSNLYRHILHNLQAVAFEAHAFGGIVCHQTHFLNAEHVQNLGTNAIIALVGPAMVKILHPIPKTCPSE